MQFVYSSRIIGADKHIWISARKEPEARRYDLDKNGKVDLVIYEGTKPTVPGAQLLKLGSEIQLENGNKGGNIVVNGHITKKFNEARDYLYPIPKQERLLNPNLTQNPNWE